MLFTEVNHFFRLRLFSVLAGILVDRRHWFAAKGALQTSILPLILCSNLKNRGAPLIKRPIARLAAELSQMRLVYRQEEALQTLSQCMSGVYAKSVTVWSQPFQACS